MHTSFRFIFLITFLITACTSAEQVLDQESPADVHSNVHDTVAELIVKMPVSDPVEQNWLNEELIETGSSGIRVLTGMLAVPGTGDDTYARYALSSLAQFVSRPGADAERSAFERTILEELRAGHSASAKTFLIQQLELTGSDRSVPVMEQFLRGDRLYKPAIDLLITIETPMAVQALREALPGADGVKRIALIKALGELQDSAAAGMIIEAASSDDWPTRRMALYALAKIGNPSAGEAFDRAVETTDDTRQAEVISFYLDFADRLAEQGYQQESEEIVRRFLGGEYPGHVRASALHTLFQFEGIQMLDELLVLAGSSDATLRAQALSLANSLEGEEVTQVLAASLNQASASRQADIIHALGERRDASALPAVKSFLEDSAWQTRVAAAETLFRLDGADSLPVIIEALNRSRQKEEAEALEAVLLQMPTRNLISTAARNLSSSNEFAKPVMIRILASRSAVDHLDLVLQQIESDHEEVRFEVYNNLQFLAGPDDLPKLVNLINADRDEEEITAIQSAIAGVINRVEEAAKRDEIIIQALIESSDGQKPYLLELFPQVDGIETLNVATQALDHANPSIRTAAIKALAAWPDPLALPALLDAAAIAPESLLPGVYEGYVRLVNRSSYPVEEKVRFLHYLVESTSSIQQKAKIVDHFSSLEDLVALQAAGRYFHNKEDAIRESAFQVASGVLGSLYEPGSSELNISNAFLASLDESIRSSLLNELDKEIERIAEAASTETYQTEQEDMAEAKYGRLFNGRDLDGWEAIGSNPDAWGVEDGILYTDGVGSGWLSTKSTYDDFIIELEYRVPDGGNSGVFLRAPREGNPAFAGMEIQILDDYADRYAELEPWQYTGSIYNVKAPSKRVTRPAGEWQSMVIKANGPVIKVTLNGELILNTNLINHMELVDGHPGLTRRYGYVGLQNHSNRVDFRNIVIREIE